MAASKGKLFQHLGQNGSTKLRAHVVSDDGNTRFFELQGPRRITRKKNGNAVDHGNLVAQADIGPKLGGERRAHGQVVEQNIGFIFAQNGINLLVLLEIDLGRQFLAQYETMLIVNSDIGQGRAVSVHVRRDAIQDRTKVDLSRSDWRAIRLNNFLATIGLALDGITDLESDLAIVNVKGHHKGNIGRHLAPNVALHETRGRILLGTLRALLPDTLDECRSTIANSDDADFDCHLS